MELGLCVDEFLIAIACDVWPKPYERLSFHQSRSRAGYLRELAPLEPPKRLSVLLHCNRFRGVQPIGGELPPHLPAWDSSQRAERQSGRHLLVTWMLNLNCR